MTSSLSPPAEQLSALADGELSGPDLERVLAACAQDPQLSARWHDYHLIGEVLRGQAAVPAGEAGRLDRLRSALQAQPLCGVPRAPAANQPGHWRWFAAAASVALAVVLAWAWPGGWNDDAELAWGETPVLARTPQGAVVRDAALEELLEAHRQQGGASVLPMPSGFLRNATFEADPAPSPSPAGR